MDIGNILSHTPLFVYVIFFGVLAFLILSYVIKHIFSFIAFIITIVLVIIIIIYMFT